MKLTKQIVYILFLGLLVNNLSIQAGQVFSRRKKPKKISEYPELYRKTRILAKTIMKFYKKVREHSGSFDKEVEVLKLKINEFNSDDFLDLINLDYPNYAKQFYVNDSGLPTKLLLNFSEELENLIRDFRSILERNDKPFYPVFYKYYSYEMPVEFLFFWKNVIEIVNSIVEENQLENFKDGSLVSKMRYDITCAHFAYKFAKALLALDRDLR